MAVGLDLKEDLGGDIVLEDVKLLVLILRKTWNEILVFWMSLTLILILKKFLRGDPGLVGVLDIDLDLEEVLEGRSCSCGCPGRRS